ncbi:sensor histidine kinase [Lacticaseibacillus zhaodongensis]|uniref:sensor histidine kinase n=1 Tax=Lacticaseibacillus zhaodongensis TaxID=2668065 RepID=UPI0012D2AE82|nr:HAMP domain-containing histidine kinase [Lacticaseibacillus zhaodongensis]
MDGTHEDQSSSAKSRRFISLRWRWAATVGFGIFLTFLVFAIIIYGVMRQTLVTQEKNTVTDTVNAVRARLTPVAENLTVSAVRPLLDTSISQGEDMYLPNQRRSNISIFSDTTIQKMSRADFNVSVYDRSGKLLFNSRPNPLKFQRSERLAVKSERNTKFDGIVGRAAVISDGTGRRIGYVQVADGMTAFHHTMDTITDTIYMISIAALLISAMVGFWLANRFLRPIKRITTTIDAINGEPESDARIEQIASNDELSHLISEFNAMLDRMQRYIDQQTDFVGDVSHELRTPVAVLEGHLQLLNRWGKDDPEVLDESLKASLQEVARMKSLIQEMLDLTRADQVDTQFANAVTDAQPVIAQVVDDMQMIHPDFAITLEDDLKGKNWVQIYRNHLEQVMIILVDNAVKYSKQRKEVHVSVATSHNELDIAVQDFGEGISPENVARVFNRFYRVDKARSREKGGNGLGLAIAKQLIDGYGGSLSLDSVVGSGSVFRIALPLLTDAQAQAFRDAAAQDGDGATSDSLSGSQL